MWDQDQLRQDAVNKTKSKFDCSITWKTTFFVLIVHKIAIG